MQKCSKCGNFVGISVGEYFVLTLTSASGRLYGLDGKPIRHNALLCGSCANILKNTFLKGEGVEE